MSVAPGLFGSALVFQSLFYWKLLWKRAQFLADARPKCSFNPCSIGNCSGRVLRFTHQIYENEVSILVLLEIALEVST